MKLDDLITTGKAWPDEPVLDTSILRADGASDGLLEHTVRGCQVLLQTIQLSID